MMRFTPPQSRVLHRHILILTAVRFVFGVGMLLLLARLTFDPARPVLAGVLVAGALIYGSAGIFSWTRLYRSYVLRKEQESP
jgi:hypothetical protein